MKAASITELKRELANLNPKDLLETFIRVAKYKKENKELLSYLLFDADDQLAYIQNIKDEMDLQFTDIKKYNTYNATKVLRKALRMVNKYIKFSANKQTEVELLIYYCNKVKDSGINIYRHAALLNLYKRQIEKIEKAISHLHEDLQYDFQQRMKELD